MSNQSVYEIVDFILNKATDPEMEIIISAIKRRLEDTAHGYDKMNPEKMARQMSSQINKQVGASVEQIRGMVRNFVAEKIKQEAPEISEHEVEQLLNAWVPDEQTSAQRSERAATSLPKDVLLTMIRQFLAYSAGTMSGSEQVKLQEEIPDWPEKYWAKFPDDIRKLLTLFLKGKITPDTFWSAIENYFGTVAE